MLGPHFRQPGPAVPPELQVRKAAEAPTAAAVLAPNPQRARRRIGRPTGLELVRDESYSLVDHPGLYVLVVHREAPAGRIAHEIIGDA